MPSLLQEAIQGIADCFQYRKRYYRENEGGEMQKSSTATKETEGADVSKALSTISLPNYEIGALSTDMVAQHAVDLLGGWQDMDGETHSRGISALRQSTKFLDSYRGLERLRLETERLNLRIQSVNRKQAAA